MTLATLIASALPFLCLVAALFRAPLVALPLAPPCLAILACALGLVDISSASHPLRYVVPASSAALALGVAWAYSQRRYYDLSIGPLTLRSGTSIAPSPRAVVASLLVFASSGPDVLALLAWRLPGLWILVPFQIGLCFALAAVLLVPERWLKWSK